MALGIFGSALKSLRSPKISFIISLALAIGVVYTCVSPWLDDDDSDELSDLKNVDRKISKHSSVTKSRVKKRRMVKFVPELTLSQKNQDDVSTEFLSFRFGSANISHLQSNIIYATTLKSKATQTDSVSTNAISNYNYNYIDINDLHSPIEYREIKRNDPPEIGVTRQKIVKPPRKHPPISRTNKSLMISTNNDNSKGKLYSSLYPEVHIVNHDNSKSFKSVIDQNDYHHHQNKNQKSSSRSSSPERKLSYFKETVEQSELPDSNSSQKSKSLTNFVKKCRPMLNFNDLDSESKSTSKSWSSITSALGSQPAGHSTLIDINLSGDEAAGGQDEDYHLQEQTPKQLQTQSNENVCSSQLVNLHSEGSVVKTKNLVVEINSKECPESRIIDDDNYYYSHYCNDFGFDLSSDKSKINYNESSRITGFSKDLHQFMKDVKSFFKIPHNYHNSNKNNNDNNGWIKMSTLKRNSSMMFKKINHNNNNNNNTNERCYSLL